MADMWQAIRKDFPVTKKYTYLDHAAGGIVPVPVADRVAAFYRQSSRHGDFVWPEWMKTRERIRRKTAAFIHAEPEEIGFVTNTSQGMNYIAELLHPAGTVLTNTEEFPSSTVPWVWRKSKIIWQKPQKKIILLHELQKHLKPSVKTIVTSYVQYASGFRQDLTRLGQIKGNRYLVVNASQAFGALPLDVKKWKADFLTANSYKWLMGGYGGGILYIRKKWLKRFRPWTVGWRSAVKPEKMNNREMKLSYQSSRYELGSPSFPNIIGLGAAVDYLSEIGKERIEKRILELTGYLIERLDQKGIGVLSPRQPAHRSGIVIAKVKNAQRSWNRLIRKKIFTTVRGGGIRIAPHFYNSFGELDKLVKYL